MLDLTAVDLDKFVFVIGQLLVLKFLDGYLLQFSGKLCKLIKVLLIGL